MLRALPFELSRHVGLLGSIVVSRFVNFKGAGRVVNQRVGVGGAELGYEPLEIQYALAQRGDSAGVHEMVG